jgi:hypothetical protein
MIDKLKAIIVWTFFLVMFLCIITPLGIAIRVVGIDYLSVKKSEKLLSYWENK